MDRSDFCQGHGSGRDCTYYPETGDCDHGYDFDHGVISYCDGTCAEARDAYRDHLDREGLHESLIASTTTLTLQVDGHGRTPESYTVTFEGPDAGPWALAYMAARPGFYFTELPEAPNHLAAFPGLAEVLYPQCHHGLSAKQCMDPYGDAHFGTREWEMAQYGY